MNINDFSPSFNPLLLHHQDALRILFSGHLFLSYWFQDLSITSQLLLQNRKIKKEEKRVHNMLKMLEKWKPRSYLFIRKHVLCALKNHIRVDSSPYSMDFAHFLSKKEKKRIADMFANSSGEIALAILNLLKDIRSKENEKNKIIYTSNKEALKNHRTSCISKVIDKYSNLSPCFQRHFFFTLRQACKMFSFSQEEITSIDCRLRYHNDEEISKNLYYPSIEYIREKFEVDPDQEYLDMFSFFSSKERAIFKK